MNTKSYFGKFGGQYVPETAMFALNELESEYLKAKADPTFQEELNDLLKNYVGRPTPLYHAKNLSAHYGQQIYLKLIRLTMLWGKYCLPTVWARKK